MKLGVVVDDHWGFIRELLADWQSRYQTQVFQFHNIHLPLLQGRVNRLRLRRSLEQFLGSNDVVFFEWAGPLLVEASHLQARARILVRLHSFELFAYAPRIHWESVARIILVSDTMQRHFCELYPAAAHKTVVVYNGVALERFVKSERQFSSVIGMLGSLLPIKRIYEAILALYELDKMGFHLSLRIAGPAEKGAEPERYYLALQRLVRELGLEQQVKFIGQVIDVPTFLKGVDILVSNSYWEGQQVALLEAMATGCFCLAHFWDGADEVLPQENLFVTDRELREKIISYYELPESEKFCLQAKMRAIAEGKFDFRTTARTTRAVLESVAHQQAN